MRWLCDSRLLLIALIVLAVVVYLMMWESIPLLWPYGDHPLVWCLLVLLSGGYVEELLYETGSCL